MKRSLKLIVDTNVFHECRKLETLDWTVLGEFDDIDLVVVRPVQQELDRQKSESRSRITKSARDANARLRIIIQSTDDEMLLRESNPRVRLIIRLDVRPDSALSDLLDYAIADDQIVGIAHALWKQTDEDVRLMSHDTGPMQSAKTVGLPVEWIPDEWLRPLEDDADTKKRKELEREITRLQQQEPLLDLRCLDVEGNAVERLEIERPDWIAFSATDVDQLIDRLRVAFPRQTKFNSGSRISPFSSGSLMAWQPASEKEINRYQNESYPEWIDRCKSIFEQLHRRAGEFPSMHDIELELKNLGTRPAERLLLTINCQGPFSFEDPDRIDTENLVELPEVPSAPKGRQGSMFPVLPRLILPGISSIGTLNLGALHASSYSRDPENFYYRDDRETGPVPKYELQCGLFRHGREPWRAREIIRATKQSNVLRGRLLFKIHADSLSTPVSLSVAVKMETIQTKPFAVAEKLIGSLIASNSKTELPY